MVKLFAIILNYIINVILKKVDHAMNANIIQQSQFKLKENNMTNYERIKGMSDNSLSLELEWFLDGASCYAICKGLCPTNSDSECARHILGWLNKEAEKDDLT